MNAIPFDDDGSLCIDMIGNDYLDGRGYHFTDGGECACAEACARP